MDDSPANSLTHVDAGGNARMVDVGDKQPGDRRARARARVTMNPDVAMMVVEGNNKKGDVMAVCRIAGIQAAKRTAELVPLAHQVPLSHVDVDIHIDAPSGVALIETSARTVAGTGVEIEAMVAASIAAVTFYDMVKALDRWATIEDVRMIEKSGGRSGTHILEGSTHAG